MSTNTDVQVKTATFEVKAAGPDDNLAEGEFVGYASVFGNVDSYGDIVDAKAFDRTLKEWAATGDTIPVLWGHDLFDPFSNIGGVKTATPDEHGLKIHGFLDVVDNPKAAQVYRLMKGRRTRKMSFAYSTRDSKSGDDGNHLLDLDLFEVSVVQIPANQEAEVLTVKHATDALLAKAGRVLSSKNERSLREARDAIDSVLSALATQDDEDGEAGKTASTPATANGDPSETNPEGQTEELPGANVPPTGEESKSGPSVETWDLLFQTYQTAHVVEGV